MTLEQALAIINQVVYAQIGRYLSDIEQVIFTGAWQSQTYEQIAQIHGYSVKYLKDDSGRKFWKLLTEVLGEPVGKKNFRCVVERLSQPLSPGQAQPPAAIAPIAPLVTPQTTVFASVKTDWGEAIDVAKFYGRSAELTTLTQWIVGDQCRLVALLGLGGIGKTALSVKLANQLLIASQLPDQPEFEFIIWRSLRNAPPIDTLLADLVPFLSQQQDTRPNLSRLMHWLRSSRALVILDNLETLLQPEYVGQFRAGYENYSELLRIVSETNHQSCLILTSREKPAEVAAFEGNEFKVRSMQLSGSQQAAQAILQAKGVIGSDEQKQQLGNRYGNIPLALKIVATSIQDLFGGEVSEFLEQDTAVFNGVRRLLAQQFDRLSYLEQCVMYWLAINREWTSISELHEDIIPAVSRSRVLETLEYLVARSLIEKKAGSYTQQPVVMEYVTEQLIEKITSELSSAELDVFLSYALLKTTLKDYVRESQVRLIVQPIVYELSRTFSSIAALKQQILRILTELRQAKTRHWGYGVGNLINLCCYLQLDLTNYNFSGLTIRHAYLQEVKLHYTNFAYAELSKTAFTQTFSAVIATAFSPDGQHLITGDDQGEIRLWRVADGQLLLTSKGHSNWVWSVAFSPDGRTFASGSIDCLIKLWDKETGECLRVFQGHTDSVLPITFSPDGRTLISGSKDQTIKFWDVNTGDCLNTLQTPDHWVCSVRFSPDGKTIVSSSRESALKLWDVNSGQCLKILQGHTAEIWSVAFSPDGRVIASGSFDHTIKLWDVETGRCLKTLQGHEQWIWSIAFSPDGRMLASGGIEPVARLWNIETGQCCGVLPGHTSQIWSVAFSSDGQTLATSSADQSVKLWDIRTRQALRSWQGFTTQIRFVAFSPNGQLLASGSNDRTVNLWDVRTGKRYSILQGHADQIWDGAFSPDGQTLATGSSDTTIRLWDVLTGQVQQVLSEGNSWVITVDWHPDGQLLASGIAANDVQLWSIPQGEVLRTLKGHLRMIWSIAFSPDGRILASGSDDQTIRLWDVETGQCLHVIQDHVTWFNALVFTDNGQTLISGGTDGILRQWDVQTGECLNTLEGHTQAIRSVAFSPDDQLLTSSSSDGTIKIWDAHTLKCLRTLKGHIGVVMSIAFAAVDYAGCSNHQLLASGGEDQTIRFWDLETGECVRTLRAERPYEGMNITGITGVTEAQKATLKALGAIETVNATSNI
jgi:WD40 repeat protein